MDEFDFCVLIGADGDKGIINGNSSKFLICRGGVEGYEGDICIEVLKKRLFFCPDFDFRRAGFYRFAFIFGEKARKRVIVCKFVDILDIYADLFIF